MTRFQVWEDFQAAAERLARESGGKARCVSKYRNEEGELNVRITDDFQSLQFTTRERQDMKKVEQFTLRFQQIITGTCPP